MNAEGSVAKALKRCSCGANWKTLELFLHDENIQLLGFQESYVPDDEGAYLYNHLLCGNTLALPESTMLRNLSTN